MGAIMKENRFIIYSAGYNCEKYVKIHMDTIKSQTYKNYSHIMIDDASTDGTYEIIKENSDEKTIAFKNEENLGWLHNSVQYLTAKEDEIIVIIDMDDFLLHTHVLEIINKIYNETDCWLTYGSFIWFTKKIIEGREYPKAVIRYNTFRDYEWLCVHPQTFKGLLWNKINTNDFKDKDGEYLRACYDQAIMLPMLEMCPIDKTKCIKEPFYVYNDHNPLNLMKTHKQYQIDCEKYIRSLPKYDRI